MSPTYTHVTQDLAQSFDIHQTSIGFLENRGGSLQQFDWL